MSYVEVVRVSKRFGGLTVLDEICLTIEKGKLVTLLGPSGCGKSTLLRCIAGLTDVDSGAILVDGREITHLPPRLRGVGMVFQSYALFPNLTVYENIAFGLKMKDQKNGTIASRVNRMIELVDLAGKERSYPRELSGGQQQRVALARALVVEPKVLLLDEPLNALDAKIRKLLQLELKSIQRELGITMVFVTHDQEEALTISDRILVINNGRVIQSGNPKEVYTTPASEFVARFIGNFNVLKREEFQALVGTEELPGKSFAIRPEVIELLTEYSPGNGCRPPQEDAWVVKGKVFSITVKGNVLRYQVKSRDIILQVDRLNTPAQLDIENGMTVDLLIPKTQCISLQ